MKRIAYGIILTLLLMGIWALAFNTQPVKATATIYIRADGNVEGTDKIQRNGDIYTFTANINDSIILEKDNIVLDGANYTLRGTGVETGINLTLRQGVTLKKMIIRDFDIGIMFVNSLKNLVYHNSFMNNTENIYVYNSNSTLDNGYPSGGNYWSDYDGPDSKSGPYQNETGGDKIGDVPYIIDENNTDQYPLIYPYSFKPNPDVNDDGTVNILDAIKAAAAFGSHPGNPRWNYRADMEELDEWITILDLIKIANKFQI